MRQWEQELVVSWTIEIFIAVLWFATNSYICNAYFYSCGQ
jgi:hypothetical protein